MSCLALAMSVLNLVGCGQATSVGLSAAAPYIGFDRPNSTASMIFWYGTAYATACRTLMLSNGGLVTFMPRYWMPFEYGVEMMSSLGWLLSSTKSLFGRSYEMSASPRYSNARRLPADGTMRQTMRLIFGSGPPTHLSLRSMM